MKTITIKDIKALLPAYTLLDYLPPDFSGTVLDILAVDACPWLDRVWVASKILPEGINLMFAYLTAKRAVDILLEPKQEVLQALETIKDFALGKATKENLVKAHKVCESAFKDTYLDNYLVACRATCNENSAYWAAYEGCILWGNRQKEEELQKKDLLNLICEQKMSKSDQIKEKIKELENELRELKKELELEEGAYLVDVFDSPGDLGIVFIFNNHPVAIYQSSDDCTFQNYENDFSGFNLEDNKIIRKLSKEDLKSLIKGK